ncbi:hypothetical protein Fot_48924 [Forsythia ovata]|uniref:Uncharacterized protein n=1 Tax=Forsythia ovata TaxID=205694 RepID=A0ABD1QAF2_9LAMI
MVGHEAHTISVKNGANESSSKGKTAKQSNIHYAGKGFIQAPQEAQYPVLNLSQGAQYQPCLLAYGVNFVPTYGTSQHLMSMFFPVRQPEEDIFDDLLVIPRFHVTHNQ